jgi:hypothetical protein
MSAEKKKTVADLARDAANTGELIEALANLFFSEDEGTLKEDCRWMFSFVFNSILSHISEEDTWTLKVTDDAQMFLLAWYIQQLTRQTIIAPTQRAKDFKGKRWKEFWEAVRNWTPIELIKKAKSTNDLKWALADLFKIGSYLHLLPRYQNRQIEIVDAIRNHRTASDVTLDASCVELTKYIHGLTSIKELNQKPGAKQWLSYWQLLTEWKPAPSPTNQQKGEPINEDEIQPPKLPPATEADWAKLAEADDLAALKTILFFTCIFQDDARLLRCLVRKEWLAKVKPGEIFPVNHYILTLTKQHYVPGVWNEDVWNKVVEYVNTQQQHAASPTDGKGAEEEVEKRGWIKKGKELWNKVPSLFSTPVEVQSQNEKDQTPPPPPQPEGDDDDDDDDDDRASIRTGVTESFSPTPEENIQRLELRLQESELTIRELKEEIELANTSIRGLKQIVARDEQAKVELNRQIDKLTTQRQHATNQLGEQLEQVGVQAKPDDLFFYIEARLPVNDQEALAALDVYSEAREHYTTALKAKMQSNPSLAVGRFIQKLILLEQETTRALFAFKHHLESSSSDAAANTITQGMQTLTIAGEHSFGMLPFITAVYAFA